MFRISARHIFLTYAQVTEFNHAEIHTHLQTIADQVYSCQEAHEDGGTHFHAIATFEQKKDIRNERYFDFRGKHPNIQSCRSLPKSVAYISKDGVTLGSPPLDSRTSRQTALTTLIHESTDRDSFIRGFEEIDPLRSIIHHAQIEGYAAKRYNRPDSFQPRDRTSFNEPRALSQWVATNLFPSPERPKCLILLSPTRYGKTEWARSLGEHSYWNNYVTADRNLNARYAVIDDMERFSSFTGAKPIFGCQKVIGINPKYSHLQQWNWGIPTIWLFNHLPAEIHPDSYYAQNAIIIELTNPLF